MKFFEAREGRLKFENKVNGEGCASVTRVYELKGEVQGVGFRDFCDMRVSDPRVNCFPMNMKDRSTVRVVLQGQSDILDEYMTNLCQEATKKLHISLPMVSLKKEGPIVTGRKFKILFKE